MPPNTPAQHNNKGKKEEPSVSSNMTRHLEEFYFFRIFI
jgi:hypothetical protein